MKDYKLIELNEVNSTNDLIKENYKNYDTNTFLQARYQTSGRGQFDRSWEAMSSKNLLISWLLKDINIYKINKIKSLVNQSIIKMLQKYNVYARFKFPNDIYVSSKKICGILIEALINKNKYEYIVIGMGININQVSFINKDATSIKLINDKEINISLFRDQLIKLLVKEIDTIL